MSRRRGPLEEQTVKVAALMKSSEHATKVRVFAVTLIAHPTEGVIISGEESLAKLMTEILKNPALAREVKEAPARGGMMVPNYFSSRREKELALKKLYNCSLPPLPMPFSELTTYAMVLGAFGEVWKSELQGTKFKVGDAMPDSFKAWFTEDEEVFRSGMDAPSRGEGGVPRPAPRCGEGGGFPAPPRKNDQNRGEVAGQNKGSNLNLLK